MIVIDSNLSVPTPLSISAACQMPFLEDEFCSKTDTRVREGRLFGSASVCQNISAGLRKEQSLKRRDSGANATPFQTFFLGLASMVI
jgi:hypothetical protein